MKNMGASDEKAFSKESASEQARSRLSGKGFVIAAFICAIAIALTALAVINNSGTSTIADDSIPMASGDVDVIKDDGDIIIGKIDREEECCGSDNVAFYASEGGTLTHDPNDDPFVAKIEADVDEPAPVRLFARYGVQTGLKEYKTSIAVTPYAHDGSITAVPDPGYKFVGWNNGQNTNPKFYIIGAHGRYTMTAYFAKTGVLDEPVYPDIESKIEADFPDGPGTTADDGTDPVKDNAAPVLPIMSVFAHNALDGKLTLAQGKSISLNGVAALAEGNYVGTITGAVKYESSNANVVTVSESGKVVAKKTGTARITISSVANPNCKKVVTVNVVKKAKYKAVKSIKKINLKGQYKANANKQIAVKVTGWNPKAPSNKNFVVSASPASKASVDPATNKITFTSKGTVKVTVKSAENPKAKKTVKVKVN